MFPVRFLVLRPCRSPTFSNRFRLFVPFPSFSPPFVLSSVFRPCLPVRLSAFVRFPCVRCKVRNVLPVRFPLSHCTAPNAAARLTPFGGFIRERASERPSVVRNACPPVVRFVGFGTHVRGHMLGRSARRVRSSNRGRDSERPSVGSYGFARRAVARRERASVVRPTFPAGVPPARRRGSEVGFFSACGSGSGLSPSPLVSRRSFSCRPRRRIRPRTEHVSAPPVGVVSRRLVRTTVGVVSRRLVRGGQVGVGGRA